MECYKQYGREEPLGGRAVSLGEGVRGVIKSDAEIGIRMMTCEER